ncbi:MAG: hypothetical protein EPN39_00295 [Chitinophagaceae bacterium]|nr:MAG: hypothetical protein EPN39_00295 [Chitinophagaceae bacterium]
MKKYLLILITLLTASNIHAQTFSEFFQQKKTQKKYLLKQIAELQSYIELAKKGYGIVSDGLNFIGDLKGGKFNLSKDYFSSLDNISHMVKKDNDIANTVSLQASINDLYNKAKKDAGSVYLSSSEKNYIQKVWSNLLDKCNDNITQLDNLTTAGHYKMTENERLQAIDKVYNDMQDKKDFANSFYNEVKVLINQRTKEQMEAKELESIYTPSP